MLPAILLALVTVHLAAILWRGHTFRVRIGGATRSHGRAATLRGWAMGVAISFGLPAIIGLALLGEAWWRDQPPLALRPLSDTLHDAGLMMPLTPLLIGMAGGTVLNAVVSVWRARRGRRAIQIGHFPDVRPTRRRDLLPAIALSLSAGVAEEAFFRLLLPLLIAQVFGSALAGVVVATLAFGAVHRYQGWRGVLATTLVGGILAGVYLATGALWMAMLFHTVIDLNALVVRPIAAGAWRKAV